MRSSSRPFPRQLGEPLAGASFAMMNHAIGRMRYLGIDIIHTARTFAVYRHMFYDNRSEADVLASLKGKQIVDVACGLTPYAPDSMFQACHRAGVSFYGVDPVLAEPRAPGLRDRAMSRWTGGSGRFLRSPPGMERALGDVAQDMPFEDQSVDEILCAYLLWVWLDDEALLAEVFREMHRVLKPGGIVRLFPLPRWNSVSRSTAALSDVLSLFDVSQEFVLGGYRARSMSAMRTVLVRR